MADAPYQTTNFLLASKGIMARYADDASPSAGFWLNQSSLEEIEEAGLASRLGTTILSKTGTSPAPLASSGIGVNTNVHSLQKLTSLSSIFGGTTAWRYAARGKNLYRLSGLSPGRGQEGEAFGGQNNE